MKCKIKCVYISVYIITGLNSECTQHKYAKKKHYRTTTKNVHVVNCLTAVHLDVATLQSQAKASLLIFDEVQRHLRVALLLQVGNDGLAY